MKILKSENHNQFTTLQGNREVSKKKVKKLIQSYQDGLDLFPYCPLVVAKGDKDSFVILDGQHRFMACLEMALPIYYVVADADISLRQIARMNSATDKWREADFMHCYVELGNNHYKRLAEFMRTYEVRYTTAIQLTMWGKMYAQRMSLEKFRDGQYECNYYQEAEKVIQLMDFLFGKYVFRRDKVLIAAVIDLQDQEVWDVERMEKQLRKYPHDLQAQSSKKNWILHLEQIYNKGAHKRKPIWQ